MIVLECKKEKNPYSLLEQVIEIRPSDIAIHIKVKLLYQSKIIVSK